MPNFNDDIQSTAAVTLAAILGATRLPGVPALEKQRILFFGAGQANIGAAQLIQQALMDEGFDEADAQSRLWLFDSQVRREFLPGLTAVLCLHGQVYNSLLGYPNSTVLSG